MGDAIPEVHSRIVQARKCLSKYSRVVYDSALSLRHQGSSLEEGSDRDHTVELRDLDALCNARSGFVLRGLNMHSSSRSALDHHMLSYREALERTGYECIEASVMRTILLHAGHIVRMHDEVFPRNRHV